MSSEYHLTYWTEAGFKPDGSMWPELANLYTRVLPPAGRVLDLGCGDGATSGIWLRQHGYNYIGADVSPSGLEACVLKGFQTQALAAGEPLPFPDASFDTIVCVEGLEHVFLPLDLVLEARRVLKPRDVFVCTTPNFLYWRSRVNIALGRFDPVGDHLSHREPWRETDIRFFSASTMKRMLFQAGFSSDKIEGQRGGLQNDVPYPRRRLQERESSATHKALERRLPQLFGYCPAAYAET